MTGVQESIFLDSPVDSEANRDEIIVYYSLMGLSTQYIQRLLQSRGLVYSKRHIRRLRKKLGVSSRREENSLSEICEVIRSELQGSGSLLGYRGMHQRLQSSYGLSVRRDTVMMLLPVLDPEGSSERSQRRLRRRIYRSKGPNYIWHLDGYDKLKPFGFAIHGCIDGYSRRIIWMNCGSSNNDPSIVAQLYLKSAEYIQGIPRLIRADRGTENSEIAFIHPTLRSIHSDDFANEMSFRYGRSTSNQRIESWWSYLRCRMTDWWISFFKDLRDTGYFEDCLVQHIEALRFCFMPVLQAELKKLVTEWNHHVIRHSRNAECPGGIPEILYNIPEMSGALDYKCSLDTDLFEYANAYYGSPSCDCDESFKSYAQKVLDENSLESPTTTVDAMNLLSLLLVDMQNY